MGFISSMEIEMTKREASPEGRMNDEEVGR
jgi:hypothetical protein